MHLIIRYFLPYNIYLRLRKVQKEADKTNNYPLTNLSSFPVIPKLLFEWIMYKSSELCYLINILALSLKALEFLRHYDKINDSFGVVNFCQYVRIYVKETLLISI